MVNFAAVCFQAVINKIFANYLKYFYKMFLNIFYNF